MRRYDISELPRWKVNILTSVLAEYGVTSTVNLTWLEVEGGDLEVGLPVALQKAGIARLEEVV